MEERCQRSSHSPLNSKRRWPWKSACFSQRKYKLFWARYLEGSSLSSLPPHYEDTQGNSTNNYRLPIYEGLRNKLIGLANSMRLPIRTILLSAHLRVISLLSGCQDIVSGSFLIHVSKKRMRNRSWVLLKYSPSSGNFASGILGRFDSGDF